MNVPPGAWVFDTGPLRHFAAAGWLGLLRHLAPGLGTLLVPQSVERELKEATEHESALRSLLDDARLEVWRDEDPAFLRAFADFERRLVEGKRNLGECGVLAMGEVFGCTVVLDDETPRQLAQDEGLKVMSTVQLLADAVRGKHLSLEAAESVADDLLTTKYYLPFGPGGFRQHLLENGLIDYEDLASSD